MSNRPQGGGTAWRDPGPVWADPLTAWRAHLAHAGRTPATIRTWCDSVRRAAVEADPDQWGPWELTNRQLSRWIDGLNISHATRRKILTALRTFYAWALTAGHCERSPVAGIGLDPLPPGPRAVANVGRVWQAALEDWATWLRASGRAPSTIGVYLSRLTLLGKTYADPWRVNLQDLAQWLANPDWSAEARRGARTTVRGFYGWAVQTGRTAANPADMLVTVRLPRALPRPVPRDVLTDALAGADDRARLAMLCGALAGLRRAEVAGLAWADWAGGQLRVHGKGGHERYVPAHPLLAEALAAERDHRRNGGHGTGWHPAAARSPWIFPSSDPDRPITAAHLGKIVTRALGNTGWTSHTLRHYFASSAYAAQRDLRAVQELLGHAKPETTARYASVPEGAKLTAVTGVTL